MTDDPARALNDAFLALPAADVAELFARIHAEATAAKILYDDDDGVSQVVPILARPRVIHRDAERSMHEVCREANRALEQLAARYVADPRVRELLPFHEREERWFREVWSAVGEQPQTVLARLDANITSGPVSDWVPLQRTAPRAFQFFETNTVGAGGLYYGPAVGEILQRVTLPALGVAAAALEPQLDLRDLLHAELVTHARAIGRPRLHVAVVQELDAIGGPSEFPHLAAALRARGVTAVLADPRELVVHGDEVVVRRDGKPDLPIDVVYRDGEMATFLDLEDDGADLAGLRRAFLGNQVVSSMAGELDHKSAFEILTSPDLAGGFTLRQQQIFRDHVLWTRLVRETRSTSPDGDAIDLLPWLRANRERLVLKPNRSFGGAGIVVGPHVAEAAWEDALAAALGPDAADTGGVVAQRYVEVHVDEFPVIAASGAIELDTFYVVSGVFATDAGTGIFGRASQQRVVNVGQRGGLTGTVRAR